MKRNLINKVYVENEKKLVSADPTIGNNTVQANKTIRSFGMYGWKVDKILNIDYLKVQWHAFESNTAISSIRMFRLCYIYLFYLFYTLLKRKRKRKHQKSCNLTLLPLSAD